VSQHLAWYVSRATGIVAWGLIVASMVWGFLYATRVLGRKARPWWMLGVHRFLGALAIVFVLVHVLAIVADSYTSFGLVDALLRSQAVQSTPYGGAVRRARVSPAAGDCTTVRELASASSIARTFPDAR